MMSKTATIALSALVIVKGVPMKLATRKPPETEKLLMDEIESVVMDSIYETPGCLYTLGLEHGSESKSPEGVYYGDHDKPCKDLHAGLSHEAKELLKKNEEYIKGVFTKPDEEFWKLYHGDSDMKFPEGWAAENLIHSRANTVDANDEDHPAEAEDVRFAEQAKDNHKLPEAFPLWKTGSIPFCLDQVPIKARFLLWGGFDLLSAAGTNVRFVSVQCDDPGHKIKIIDLGVGGRPYAYTGMVDQNNAVAHGALEQANSAHAHGKPVTSQELGLEHRVYNKAAVMAHELIHVLGFGHTNQRSDWEVCTTGVGYDDQSEPNNCAELPGQLHGTYDFDSIMHYPNSPPHLNCAAIAHQPHYNPNNCLGDPANMGQATTLSAGDVIAINDVYN